MRNRSELLNKVIELAILTGENINLLEMDLKVRDLYGVMRVGKILEPTGTELSLDVMSRYSHLYEDIALDIIEYNGYSETVNIITCELSVKALSVAICYNHIVKLLEEISREEEEGLC